jgi:hypothetical protein
MRFVVVVRDPQIDLYLEDDLIVCEVVEAEDENEACKKVYYSEDYEHMGYLKMASQVEDDMPLGECEYGSWFVKRDD